MNDYPNTRFALVIGEAQGEKPVDRRHNWTNFSATVQNSARPDAETKKIHDNVWLIPLETEMLFLSELIQWANNSQIVLRILFLNDEPDWIQYPKPDKSKPS